MSSQRESSSAVDRAEVPAKAQTTSNRTPGVTAAEPEFFCDDDVYSTYLRSTQTFLDPKKNRQNSRAKKHEHTAKQTYEINEILSPHRRQGYFGGLPVVHNPAVEKWIRYFREQGRGTFLRWLVRAESLREPIMSALRSEGLPEEFFYLAMIESGFSNTAKSSKKATGTWQFMRGTAKLYDLRMDYWIDERRDPLKSTLAAARLLRDLYADFGDWYLAMAAYNAGPGKVRRAIRGAASRDFWTIAQTNYLRPETKNYVPKMLAALYLCINSDSQGYAVAGRDSYLIPDSAVEFVEAARLEDVARKLQIEESQLRSWNPELIKEVIPAKQDRPYQLRVPSAVQPLLVAAMRDLPKIKISDVQLYAIRAGDTLSNIARRYQVSLQKLKEYNPKISSKALRIGHQIAVPVPGVVIR